VVTASGSVALRWSAYSYSGVDYNDPFNGTDTSSGTAVTTISTDITTTADNTWMWMFMKDNNGTKVQTSSTGDSIRLVSDAGGQAVADTGAAVTPAGANTMTLNWTGNVNVGAIAIAFKPAGASSAVKTAEGLAIASVKTGLGLATASVKNWQGLA